uniref:Uncharacterized protein n=1 Tax=Anguilla anguilla TaxID=7936 RepID=A0A0E9UJE8_ANGAN
MNITTDPNLLFWFDRALARLQKSDTTVMYGERGV